MRVSSPAPDYLSFYHFWFRHRIGLFSHDQLPSASSYKQLECFGTFRDITVAQPMAIGKQQILV